MGTLDMVYDQKSECENEIAGYAKSKNFWSGYLDSLKEKGINPRNEEVQWVEQHLKGLDQNSSHVQSILNEIIRRNNA